MLEEGGREQLGLGGATKIGDTGVSQNGGEKKGEEAREEEERKLTTSRIFVTDCA